MAMTRVSTLLLAFALLLIATPSRALTVDEVVAKNIEARGGVARLKAIQSIRIFGTAKFGDGDWSMEATLASITKRPGKSRSEFTLQGMTGVDVYDGSDGWSTEPWGGRKDPFHKSKDETKAMAQDADIDGPLVDWRAKGHRVEYLGTEDIDGTAAHKLRISLKDGDVEYQYLDPDTFLEIRETKESHVRGAEHVHEVDLGAYAQVAGVWMPFESDAGAKGEPKTAHFRVARVEVNVDAADSLFAFPAPGTRVGKLLTEGPPSPAATLGGGAIPPPAPHTVLDSGALSGVGARNIGSAAMSGRVSAVAAFDEDGKTTIFVGAASGGVWKSIDGGTTFKPVFDKQRVQSIGAIAVDPSNTKTVWVGTGEAWTRNSVSIGDGIYKSTDGGSTWTNTGLPESERVSRILVSPANGDVVYACVPGRLWSDSADRGVYKTTDGGKHWSLILKGMNLSTGCGGLAMDPKNPDVLFAGTWDFRRKGWSFRSGGDGPDVPSGSSLYRTGDGGKTWAPITPDAKKGIPAKPWGRVEVAVAPSDPKVVYAFIESKDSALFRSSDGGATWERRDSSQNMVWRPFYFARLIVDPKNPDRLFKPDLSLIVSDDGGRSFTNTSGGSHGDWHDLWIDPSNPKHIIGGDDGGLWTSFDGGSRWWKFNNLPISQFYHVSVDDKDPYLVYGGLQDNSSWVGPSSYPGGITNQRWENLYGGDGFWAMVDPSNPDFVYAEYQGGFIGRIDRKSLANRDIQPTALYKEKLRFNWNTPIHASPSGNGTVYIGAQFLFRSRDHGDTWERISPDLTTNDKEKQKQEESGGVTVDNSSAEMHTTIYSISESPKDSSTIWVGTDDGNVQLTRDAGKTWTNLTTNVKGIPRASWVSWIEASRFDPATAYAAFDRHTFGDMEPWVYRTTDFGKTWTRIVGPWHNVRGYAHVIKEDAVKPTLLFLGTELGLYVSVDGGTHWAEFKGGDFPSVAVRDIQAQTRENDLVIATHGRGIWIIDDLTALRAIDPPVLAQTALFLPGRPVQERMPAGGGWSDGDATFTGQNAPGGAVITYYQANRHLFGPIKLEVLDSAGKLVDTLPATKRRGINRVSWSMHLTPPRVPPAVQLAYSSTQGPRVLPGTYTVRLTKGAQVIETKIEVGLDRRAPYSVADRRAELDAAIRAKDLFGAMSALTDRIDGAKRAAAERRGAVGEKDPLAAKLGAIEKELEEARKKIVATKEGGAITGEERIREHLDQLYGALTHWEGRPAPYQVERIGALARELDDVEKEVSAIVERDVKPIQGALEQHHLEPIPTAFDRESDEEAPRGEVTVAALRCLTSRGRECEDAERAAAAKQGEREGERD
jgi:photosystem II stability/assembly factor-like uncharacterized protein